MKKLYALLDWFLNYKHLGRFPIVFILLVYFFPAILGIVLLDDQYTWQFLQLLLLTCVAYTVAYYYLKNCDLTLKPGKKFVININHLIIILFGSYLVFFLYVIITAPHLAIIEVFQKSNTTNYANAAFRNFQLRQGFLKTRHGWEVILPYINGVFISALIPFLIATLFLLRHKLRFLILTIFILTLFTSLEKALIIKALLPLLVLSVNNAFAKKIYAILIIALMGGIIFLTTLIVTPPQTVNTSTNTATKTKIIQPVHQGLVERVRANRKILLTGNTAYNLINRVVWIPYLTAYDWLRGFNEFRNHQYLWGKTSNFLSLFSPGKKIDMEREIFFYEAKNYTQYGISPTNPGTANTTFFIEAYVNFSWPGVIVYTVLVALITRLFVSTSNIAARSVYYYYVYLLAIGGLPAILFSSGLIVLIFIAFVSNRFAINYRTTTNSLPSNKNLHGKPENI